MKKLLLALVLIIGLIFLFNNINSSNSATEAPLEEAVEVDSIVAPEEVDSTAAPAE